MEITERHVWTLGLMVKLSYLKMARFTCVTLDTCERVLSYSRTTPSVSISYFLFLMNLSTLSIVLQYKSVVMVPLCSRNSAIVDPGLRKRRWSTPCLLTLQKSGVFLITKECWSAITVLNSFCWSVSRFGVQCASDSAISSKLLCTLFQLWHPPFSSNIRVVIWESLLTKSSILSMRSTVMTVFAWPDLESSTKPLQPTRTRALHFLTDLSNTQSYQCMVSIRRWIEASLTPSAARNWIMPPFNRRILQYEEHHVLISRHADNALYQSLWSLLCMRVPMYSPIHNKDSKRIPRCQATVPLSDTGKHVKGCIVTTFHTFSFIHSL